MIGLATATGSACAPTALGIDIGGTRLRIAEIGGDGSILRRHGEPVAVSRRAFLARLHDLVAAWAGARVVGVGVGVPGRVDRATRRVLSAGYLDIAGGELGDVVEAAAGRVAVVENDGGAALTAELAVGAARDVAHVVMFTVGTGIGGAVALDRVLIHGRATAGQLGHLTVRADGRRCRCGRRGCVETTSSGRALGSLTVEAGFPAGTSVETVFKACEAGQARAADVLYEWAAPMRNAVGSAVAAFDPDCVVIGGGLGQAMCRALERLPSQRCWYTRPIIASAFGDEAGVIGAGLLAFAAADRAPRFHDRARK